MATNPYDRQFPLPVYKVPGDPEEDQLLKEPYDPFADLRANLPEPVDENDIGWARKGLAFAARTGLPILGATLGASSGLFDAGTTSIPGAMLGGSTGGALGETLAEKIEGRPELNPTEIGLGGVFGGIPGGPFAGKIAKAASLPARLGWMGLEGAGFGATSAAAHSLAEEQRLPTLSELGHGAAGGALLGPAIGLGFHVAGYHGGSRTETPPTEGGPTPSPTQPDIWSGAPVTRASVVGPFEGTQFPSHADRNLSNFAPPESPFNLPDISGFTPPREGIAPIPRPDMDFETRPPEASPYHPGYQGMEAEPSFPSNMHIPEEPLPPGPRPAFSPAPEDNTPPFYVGEQPPSSSLLNKIDQDTQVLEALKQQYGEHSLQYQTKRQEMMGMQVDLQKQVDAVNAGEQMGIQQAAAEAAANPMDLSQYPSGQAPIFPEGQRGFPPMQPQPDQIQMPGQGGPPEGMFQPGPNMAPRRYDPAQVAAQQALIAQDPEAARAMGWFPHDLNLPERGGPFPNVPQDLVGPAGFNEEAPPFRSRPTEPTPPVEGGRDEKSEAIIPEVFAPGTIRGMDLDNMLKGMGSVGKSWKERYSPKTIGSGTTIEASGIPRLEKGGGEPPQFEQPPNPRAWQGESPEAFRHRQAEAIKGGEALPNGLRLTDLDANLPDLPQASEWAKSPEAQPLLTHIQEVFNNIAEKVGTSARLNGIAVNDRVAGVRMGDSIVTNPLVALQRAVRQVEDHFLPQMESRLGRTATPAEKANLIAEKAAYLLTANADHEIAHSTIKLAIGEDRHSPRHLEAIKFIRNLVGQEMTSLRQGLKDAILPQLDTMQAVLKKSEPIWLAHREIRASRPLEVSGGAGEAATLPGAGGTGPPRRFGGPEDPVGGVVGEGGFGGRVPSAPDEVSLPSRDTGGAGRGDEAVAAELGPSFEGGEGEVKAQPQYEELPPEDIKKIRIPEAEGREIPLPRETAATWQDISPGVKKALAKDDSYFYDKFAKRTTSEKPSPKMSDDVKAWQIKLKAKEETLLDAKGKMEAARATGVGVPEAEKAYNERLNNLAEAALVDSPSVRKIFSEADPTQSPATLIRKLSKELAVGPEGAKSLLHVYLNNPDDMAEAIRLVRKPTAFKKFMESRNSGLVSGITTNVANFSGNLVEDGAKAAETVLSGHLENWINEHGIPGTRFKKGGVATRKPMAEVQAELRSGLDAHANAWNGFAKDLSDIFHLAPEKVDVRRPLEYQGAAIGEGGKFADAMKAAGWENFHAGRLVRIPYRMLGAADKYFRTLGAGAALGKMSYRQAVTELGAKASDEDIAARVGKILEGAKDPTSAEGTALMARVAQDAAERVFQEEAPDFVKDFGNLKAKNPVLGLAVPFHTTPGNIFRRIWQRSPLGFIKVYRNLKNGVYDENTATLADDIARPLLGTIIGGTFLAAAKMGLMTGAGPTDPKEVNLLKASGWQPYSIKIPMPGEGGKYAYVPFNRFEPVSSIMSMAADYGRLDEVKQDEVGQRMIGTIASNLVSKTFLRGLSDAALLIADPMKASAQFLKSQAGGLVPNIIAKTGTAFDPTVYDTKSPNLLVAMGNEVASKIPGVAAATLPPQIDALGNVVERPGTGIERAVSPFPITFTKENSKAVEELNRLGITPSLPGTAIKMDGVNVPLNPDEVAKLKADQQKLGTELERLVSNPAYKHLPDTKLAGGRISKEAYIQRVIDTFRQQARKSVMGTWDFQNRFRKAREDTLRGASASSES